MEKLLNVRNHEILIVDDVLAICSLLADYLERKGYKTRIATSAHAACELIAARRFDLVITDMVLDDRRCQGGAEVIACVNTRLQSTPIIVISGGACREILSFSSRQSLNIAAVFDKPIALQKLHRVISDLVCRA